MKLIKNCKVKIVLLLVFLMMFPLAAQAPAGNRDYNSIKNSLLQLDGTPAGIIKDFEGGGIYGEVINVPQPDSSIKKHIGQLKFEDITIPASTNMEPVFYKWMADTMENKFPRKSGSLITPDRNYDFTDALISEITFPEMDGASKEVVYFTVKLKPETIKLSTASTETSVPAGNSQSKKLIGANFRLKIDGLSTNRILKIDALTIKNEIVTDAYGAEKSVQNQPGRLMIPNLVVTMHGDNNNAQSFIDWYNDFMVKGNNGDSNEKSGTLEYLSDNYNVMFRLKFEHLGIAKISRENRGSGDDSDKIKVEMYVEKISFEYPAAGSDSLGAIDPNDANIATASTSAPSASASSTATSSQTPATTFEQATTETPSIVALQGKLTRSETGKPVEAGGVKVTIIDLSGKEIWQDTFDGVIEKGEFNIQLGAKKELVLVPNTMYQMVVAIDAGPGKFDTADVTFGDNKPTGDVVKFKV